MYKNKKIGIIGIIITIIVLILLVVVTNIDTNKFSYVEGILNKLVMPLQNGLTYLKNKIVGNNYFFENIDNLKAENENLKKEIEEKNEQLNELGIIKAENTTLRQYSNMSEKYFEYTTVPAYIINKDIGNIIDTMVINVGTDDGVDVFMPVISGEGLVGYIVSVTNKTSKIQPIIDPATNISSTISTSRDSVVVRGMLGSNDSLKLIYISAEAELVLNDSIETSGIGGIYPRGILIGRIKEIIETKNITDRYAIIETAVDFSKLETVLVITNK